MAMLIPIRDLNPYKRFPVVTVVIIGLNVFAALATNSLFNLSNANAFRYGAVPCQVLATSCTLQSPEFAQFVPIVTSRSPYVSLFTSMFMHAGILHLGFNMLFLWVFGNNVEDRLGRIRYTIFYLVTGLAAAYAQFVISPHSFIPTLGASGAISGVLGAYIVLWPRATIVSILPLGFFFTTIRTPAYVALGLWFLLQLLGGAAGLGQVAQGGVAYLAHIGGFVAGVLLILPFLGFNRNGRTAVGEHVA